MTNSIIKPTVGRVVWFYPATNSAESGFARNSGDAPLAAIVARVWSDSMVNLTVFDADGKPHSRTSVKLLQDVQGDRPADAYCTWMPYQKGQAAKLGVAEKAAASGTNDWYDLSQRERLESHLVAGAADSLAKAPHMAGKIAAGIRHVLDALHPQQGEQVKAASAAPTVTDEMVGRFLSWPLPDDFAPDCGISFNRSPHAGMNPIGTNLLHFGQAKAMLEHCINGPFVSPVALPVIDPGPDSLELEIQAKANKAPRVTPTDIEAEISSEFYFTADDGVRGAAINKSGGCFAPPSVVRHDDTIAEGPMGLLTFCVLVLRNGFTVTGESACASPENFDAALGRKIARQNAIEKMWTLLGFRLRDRLAA